MLKRLGDRVYCLPHNHDTDRPAIGIILGDKAIMLIDAGNSQSHAELVLNNLRKLTDKPVKYIGLTHWHWDHTFGLSGYENPTVIAHPLCNEKLRWMQGLSWDDEVLEKRVLSGEESEFCAENIKKEFPDRSLIKIKTADILTEGNMSIDLGGVIVKVIYIGGEHSADSLGYFVEDENVLFLGDSLCHNMFSGPWSYDIKDFRRCLSRFSSLPAEYFVNSHWAPQNKTEFEGFIQNMERTADIAGSSTIPSEAVENYIRQIGTKPGEEQLELLRSFVEGNVKALDKASK